MLAILIVLTASCLSPSAAQSTVADANVHWARVLHKYVNEHGQVDFCGLANDQADLRAYLDYVERVSPQSEPAAFPTRKDAIAYYINSYNALAMYNIIASGRPKALGWLTRLRFFGGRRFTIGGTAMTLYTYENSVIRPLGDERVHFALNCMVVGCPQLPNQPFSGEHLDAQLDASARHFFSEPRNLQVDLAGGTVRVSSILKFYQDDFLKRSPTLIAFINRYMAREIPPDMKIEFIPYDWTVNTQERVCQAVT
ncbi:DUF547 domain-containing protein [Cupriavidus sp. KK10]|uniref:DUF547 domain-containing protein n=1 Tax=Cupriavidus sp. KK10 TaxID=1478019 RepID=UPI002012ED8C|nr:DUF547 domain-containing protein [Cupriavidus sp. KK10]